MPRVRGHTNAQRIGSAEPRHAAGADRRDLPRPGVSQGVIGKLATLGVLLRLLLVMVVATVPLIIASVARARTTKTYCTRHHHPRGCIKIPKKAQRPPNKNQQGSTSLTPSGVENGGGLGGGPGTHRQTAVDWARSQLGLTRWAWRCERFVEEAYGTRDRFDSARQAAATLHLHRGPITAAPKGSLVFFGPDVVNRGFGHVGLSLGHGNIISALARVEVTTVIHSAYWQSVYVGWADAPSTWPGRIPLPPGPTTENPSLTVQITAPAFGSTLSGTIPLAATAIGASGVDFYAYYASDPKIPSTRSWHSIGPGRYVGGAWYIDWDTTQVPDQGNPPWGTVNIAAVALGDTGALSATRDYRRFSVDNAPEILAPGGQPVQVPGAPPRGALLFASRVSASTARIIGWAEDADSPASAVSVTALVDGVPAGQGLADQPRGDVGPHGFDFLVSTDEAQRVVCARGTNIGPGADAQVGNCFTIPLFADLNGDGIVNSADLAILQAHYGQPGDYSAGDLNGDGTVNVFDLSILLSRYS